jgi:hypothetical protein
METLVSFEFTGIIVSAGILLIFGILIGMIFRKIKRHQ